MTTRRRNARRDAAAIAIAAGLAATLAPAAAQTTTNNLNTIHDTQNQQTWIALPAAEWDRLARDVDTSAVQRVIDYGETVRVLADTLTADNLADAGAANITQRPASFALTLGGQTFDPADGVPAQPRNLQTPDDANGPGLSLVQFAGPMKNDWMNALNDSGARIVAYIHPHTYVVWATPDQRDNIAARNAGVRWTGDFLSAYKLRPAFRTRDAREVQANILLVNHADAGRIIDQMQNAGAERVQRRANRLTDALSTLAISIPANKLADIAEINGVYSVQIQQTDGGNRGELTNQLTANNTDGSGLAFPGYASFLANAGVDGSGVTVAVVDSGTQQSHPDLIDNILPCTGTTCGGSSSSSHGTHTAGITAGTGASGVTSSSGFLRGQGVAPAASIIEQDYTDDFNDPGGMLLLMTESQRNGAILSTNSWGPAGTPQGYDADTLEVDTGVRDADPDAAGNQPLQYVLAIMNGNGGTTSSLGSPDEAKNIIAVGSQKGQVSSASQDTGYPDLSSNSAHGPALDGRLVPQIVAPGCDVDSSVTGNGHSLLCGTSMAAPHVAGAAALFVESHRNANSGADPSPALIKAAVTATADSLEGFDNADGQPMGAPFDRFQGWGGLNVSALTGEDGSTRNTWDQETVFDDTGEEWSVSLTPTDPSKPMRIMLAWTDALGHGLGGSTPAWNNDLDLTAQTGAGTYLGNNIGAGSVSVTGGSPDTMNNLEGIILPAGSGTANITVSAIDINSDGIPQSGDNTDQDFALFCLNCSTGPGVSLAIDGPDEFCAPGSTQYTINTAPTGGFAGNIDLSVSDVPAGFDVSITPTQVAAGDPATVSVDIDASATTGQNTFTINAVDAAGGAEPVSAAANVNLTVANGAPDAPAGLSPSTGDNAVSLAPTLSWNEVPSATSYEVELALAGTGFANPIAAATVNDDNAYTLTTALEPTTSYEWRVRAINTCGTGDWQDTQFLTADIPPVLIVDEDDNDPDNLAAFTDALNALNIAYDTWDASNNDEPEASDLAAYNAVIWFTGGKFFDDAGPDAPAEAAIQTFIDNGGCFLLSSMDYIYDRLGFDADTPNAFMSDYLGLASFNQDEDAPTVTGEPPLFGSIASQTLAYNGFTDFSDHLDPTNDAEVAFTTGSQNAGVAKITANSTAVFLGFPLEAVPADARQDILDIFLADCIDTTPDCPGDVGGDGLVNLDDLLIVLSNFGGPGDGDLDDSGTVDLDDLLTVLANFGNSCNS